MVNQWLIALVPLASAAVGAVLTYAFTSRVRRDEAITRFKEEKYAGLLVKMQGFVGATASADLKRQFLVEQYQSWLYASDEVVLAINSMIEHVKAVYHHQPGINPELGFGLVGNVVLSMRRDLLGKTGLTRDAFQYTDVDVDG